MLAAAAAGCYYVAVAKLPAAGLSVAWALFALSRGVPVGRDAISLGPLAMAGLEQVDPSMTL